MANYEDNENIIRIDDDISPYLALQAKMTPKRVFRALGHAGRYVKEDMKSQLKQGSSGGVHHAGSEVTDITQSRMIDKYRKFFKTKRARRLKKWKYMGRLTNAVWYRFGKTDKAKVRIGWFARPAERLAKVHEGGRIQSVTDPMSKHLWGITRLLWKKGLLRKGRTLLPMTGPIILEERPNVELEYRQVKDEAHKIMAEYIMRKFEQGGY